MGLNPVYHGGGSSGIARVHIDREDGYTVCGVWWGGPDHPKGFWNTTENKPTCKRCINKRKEGARANRARKKGKLPI